MMPHAFIPRPIDLRLKRCQSKYRKRKSKSAWKAFRADSDCAPCALGHLQQSYGARCVYCDHAHGRTIDHVVSKSAKPRARFDWANWRLSCGDCNNLKGTKTVVDPVRKDPRSYIVFNIATGRPEVIAVKRAKPLAEATRGMLNNQTLNEARRTARVKMVEILTRVSTGDVAARTELDGLLDRATPHRAMLRELVLETDDTLNPYRKIVDAATALVPRLQSWAVAPTVPLAP
jgi:5-methylcytosine-specific restriction endonuclease McrA